MNTIRNIRVASDEDSTLGVLFGLNGEKLGFIVEDGRREEKIPGETRVSAGRHRLKLRKQKTPLTKHYRKRFDWFKWHIELADVPNFSYVYIHIGNKESETNACQLINEDATISNDNYAGKRSASAYERFYKQIYPMLERGEDVYYEIINHD